MRLALMHNVPFIYKHRYFMLQESIDKVLTGEAAPEYMYERGNKLKQVDRKRRK